MGHEVKAEKRNWYSEDALGEKRIGPVGSVVCCSIILFALLCCAWIGPERFAMSAPSVLRGKYFEGSGVVGILLAPWCFALLAPLLGGLIDGVDRKLRPACRGRVGPRLLQPFYDVAKAPAQGPRQREQSMDDTTWRARSSLPWWAAASLCRAPIRCCALFMVTHSPRIFVVLASASTQKPVCPGRRRPRAAAGHGYEPAVLLMSVVLYLATDSF